MIGTVWKNRQTGVQYEVLEVKSYDDGVEVVVFKALSDLPGAFSERWEMARFLAHWEAV